MTRLTDLWLNEVRGSIPIPFPTQFCNMIYLQTLRLSFNKISGLFLERDLIFLLSLGSIPIELTKLGGLKEFDIQEPLLTGLIERRIGFIFICWF